MANGGSPAKGTKSQETKPKGKPTTKDGSRTK